MRDAHSSQAQAGGFLIRTLGDFSLWRTGADGQPTEQLTGAGKPLALLTYCAASRKRRHARDSLGDLLWADAPLDRRRPHVRQALWRLRRLIGDALQADDQQVLGIASVVEIDVDRWSTLLVNGEKTASWRYYEGPFLAGVHFPGGDEFSSWVDAERRRLEGLLMQHAETALSSALALEARETVRETAIGLLERAPTSLAAHRLAYRALRGIGEQAEAERIAPALSQLAVELGESPASELAALTGEPPAMAAGEPPPRQLPPLPLVGRSALLTALEGIWQEVRGAGTRQPANRADRSKSGGLRRAALFGVAGIGKSRLLSTVADRIRAHGGTVVEVKARPSDAAIPFAVATVIARAFASLPGAAGIDPGSAAQLVTLDPALRSVFPVAPSPSTTGDPDGHRALALADLLDAVCEQQPVALLIDDLHWCDAPSLTLLQMVVERARQAPCLLLTASRGLTPEWRGDEPQQAMALLPIPTEVLVETVRASGEWPDHPDVGAFIDALVRDTDGIPQLVTERLLFALASGAIGREGRRWQATDWRQAAQIVAFSSPLDQALLQASAEERALLLLLAVAGRPLPSELLDEGEDPGSPPRGRDGLDALVLRGLVVRESTGWSLVHDRARDRLLALSTAEEQQRAHRRLGAAWERLSHELRRSTSGALPLTSPRPAGADQRLAIRHLVLGGAMEEAGGLLTRWMRARRQDGDGASVHTVITECLGPEAPADDRQRLTREVPWTLRSLRNRRLVLGVVGVLGIVLIASVFWMRRYPVELFVTRSPQFADRAFALAPDAFRFVPPLVATVREHGRPSAAVVRVRALDASVALLSGDVERADSLGVATFASLRFVPKGTTVQLRFEADGARPVDVRYPLLAPSNVLGQATLSLVGGRLSGRPIRMPEGELRAAPGEPLRGYLQLRFRTSWAAASVFLAMIPTWSDGGTAPKDLMPVATPIALDVVDVPVDVVVPSRPGRYWLQYAMNAEMSGNFIASSTNWTVGQPVWNDGNDLTALPDTLIERARIAGYHVTTIARADAEDVQKAGCPLRRTASHPKPLRYCPITVGYTALRILVE